MHPIRFEFKLLQEPRNRQKGKNLPRGCSANVAEVCAPVDGASSSINSSTVNVMQGSHCGYSCARGAAREGAVMNRILCSGSCAQGGAASCSVLVENRFELVASGPEGLANVSTAARDVAEPLACDRSTVQG
eukprot:CAMPEP_0177219292 /NCGR_PEP_ID=MMETSP0367-20130122/36277_1 /TAXON_ID=447022 ORGANISM="Scrippsiella hangoei-like, Strain SHHI-4" /NCGR_SAMPLE_ID=MMETSP0367 /ASSEMBLY_ACC=CAM_ASM_000362 /LENGTH=131 /DNA_ID=CAMNT_0018668993 /DNA_START=89 /DNA_END=484 /DNA_ORIENTATION=+